MLLTSRSRSRPWRRPSDRHRGTGPPARLDPFREPNDASGRRMAVTQPPRASRLARFDTLFTAHQRHVLAYARRRTQTWADAEDVAAETLSIAWRRFDSIPESDPLLWLYAVARRVLANHHRGRGRRERLAALLHVRDIPTPLRAGEDLDGPAFAALASLSGSDQEILRLVAWEELRNQAIAS